MLCCACCLELLTTCCDALQVQAEWGNVTTVIAGLTNTYSSYVTTFEEYQEQRYEGASTIFGPHTLDAYIQVRVRLQPSCWCQIGQPSD